MKRLLYIPFDHLHPGYAVMPFGILLALAIHRFGKKDVTS